MKKENMRPRWFLRQKSTCSKKLGNYRQFTQSVFGGKSCQDQYVQVSWRFHAAFLRYVNFPELVFVKVAVAYPDRGTPRSRYAQIEVHNATICNENGDYPQIAMIFQLKYMMASVALIHSVMLSGQYMGNSRVKGKTVGRTSLTWGCQDR